MITDFLKRTAALVLFLLSLPLLAFISVVVKLTSRGPFIFQQKRAGKNKKPFVFYKVRTMVERAEALKKGLRNLNEADGPVFKIRNDPRYTRVGKFLSHTGLDELPQLLNIVKGEMDFVGPRPLPIEEAKKVPKKYQERFRILPGMTSPWIVEGAHKLSFSRWMKLDIDYAKNKSLLGDLNIFAKTAFVIIGLIIKKILKDD